MGESNNYSDGTERECPDCGGNMSKVSPHGERTRWTCPDCPRVVNNLSEFRQQDTDTDR